MHSMTIQEFIKDRQESDRPVSKQAQERIPSYLAQYSKDKKVKKAYDPHMSTVIFDTLKTSKHKYAKRVRDELKRGINDKKLTKSFYFTQKLFDTLEGFGSGFEENKSWVKYFERAVERVADSLSICTLEPYTITPNCDIRRNFTRMDTSAGFTGYGLHKEDVIPEMIEGALYYKERIAAGDRPKDIPIDPSLAFTRSQWGTVASDLSIRISDKGYYHMYKGRLVWCEDAKYATFESQYARPLIDHLSIFWANTAMGKTPNNISIMARGISEHGDWLSLDYSKYDSSVQAWVIKAAFDIVKRFFDSSYHKEIDFICYHFIHSEILMPDGKVYRTAKGIPSGSYFTQIIGSLCNAIMVLTYIEKFCEEHQKNFDFVFRNLTSYYSFIVLGDDNLLSVADSEFDFNELVNYLKSMFGITANVDKESEGRRGSDPSFLKREWRFDGQYRDPVDLLMNAMHPEREREYLNYSPWHILFGYYITYPLGMEEAGFEKELIIEGMRNSGGIEKLYHMSEYDLPGSLANIRRAGELHWKHLIDDAISGY